MATQIFADSWEDGTYDAWTVGEKYGGGDYTTAWSVQSGNLGGSGSYYLRGMADSAWFRLGHELGGDYGTVYIKCYIKSSSNLGQYAYSATPTILFMHGTTEIARLCYNALETSGDFGKWMAYRSSGTTLLVTSDNAYAMNSSPRLVEVLFTPANSGGVFKVWIDGNLVIDYTGDTTDDSEHCDRIDLFAYGGQFGATQTTLYDDFEVHDDVPSAGYSLAVDSGSFAETGTAATLKATRKLTVASGSFVETGTAATLTKSEKKIVAESGAFTESGTAAGLRAARLLSVVAGTFAESGTAAALKFSREIAAGAGSFTETGTAAGLCSTRLLSAASGAFNETGTAATLVYAVDRLLVAGAGAIDLSGTAAALYRNATLAAASGSFAETGNIAGLYRGNLKLLASPGDCFLTGSPAVLLRKALLAALSGSFVLSGTDATMNPGFGIIAGSGTFLISGGVVYFPRPGSSKTCFIFQKRRDHFRL